MTIPARYENGVFLPLQPVPMEEGTVVEVLIPETVLQSPSLANSPFAGMWKDCDDMADSVDYVNRLRRERNLNPAKPRPPARSKTSCKLFAISDRTIGPPPKLVQAP
jgi:predicted DNA-binding antitoxin AbrB/MazE fold protein